ncbi:hypothetical protein HXX76_006376 [Chlamydomonas incerta]|uniref:Uncharacterized protein n=1 Tax=Chlamydomonas incerta TaxID=51695 RepID=A0A835W5X4_CHLIN|nr:hypothetical protein HXX76_006376 [Chlamydomonas incerta]|eukprot:KAG2436856.1 hypothetical protein HXX76_006376 [Chlamydomonas incerta]
MPSAGSSRVDSTGVPSSHCGSRDEGSCYSPRGLRAMDWSDSEVLRDVLASPSGPGPRVAPSPVPPWSDAEPSLGRRALGAPSFASGVTPYQHSVTTVTAAPAASTSASQPAPGAADHASPFSGQQYSHDAAVAAAAADGAAEESLPDCITGSLLSSYLATRPSAGAAPTNTCARMASRLHRNSINGMAGSSSAGSSAGDGTGSGAVGSRARPGLMGAPSVGAEEAAALGLKLASSAAAAPLVGGSPRMRQRRATDGYRPAAADDARPQAPGAGDRRMLPLVSGLSSFDAAVVVPAGWSPPPPARISQSNLQLLLHQQPSGERKLPALPLGGTASGGGGGGGGAASYRASADGSGSFRGARPRAPAHSLFTDTKEEMATATAAQAAAQPPAPAAYPTSTSALSSPLPGLGVEGKPWAMRAPSLKSALQQPPSRRSGGGALSSFEGAWEVSASPAARGVESRMAGLFSPPPAPPQPPPPAPPLRSTRSGKYLGAAGGASGSPSVSPLYAGFGVNGYGYGHGYGHGSNAKSGASSSAAASGAVASVGGVSAIAASAAAGSRSAAALLAGARELRQLSRAVSSRVLDSASAAADAAERRAGLSTYSLPPPPALMS